MSTTSKHNNPLLWHIFATLLYPAVLGGIIYEALPMFLKALFPPSWPSSASFVLLAVISLYSNDYVYTISYTTKQPHKYNWTVFLCDVGIILMLFSAAATLFQPSVAPYWFFFFALALNKIFIMLWDKKFHGKLQTCEIDCPFLAIYLILTLLVWKLPYIVYTTGPEGSLAGLQPREVRYLYVPFLSIPSITVALDGFLYTHFLLKKPSQNSTIHKNVA